jgi:predicted ATPase
VVRDVEEDLEADPMLVCSSSQANIVALSYFLALGWTSRKRTLPFLLMDGPLQSMDDVNVLGFADLCRFARRQRQLLISTHERRFAALLERQLASRRSGDGRRVLNFASWDRRGPQIDAQDVPAQLNVSELRLLASPQAR